MRDFLTSLAPLEAFAVVFIDDAQSLSVDLFQQVRDLAETSDDPGRLQIVLVGQPPLLARLRRADSRIDSAADIGAVYARHARAGRNRRLREPPALRGRRQPARRFQRRGRRATYELSAGVPTVVNLLCDRALTLGHRALANDIDVGLVDAAACELEIARPEPVGRWLLRDALIIAAFGVLVLIGALAAARVFHEPLSRLITRWGG